MTTQFARGECAGDLVGAGEQPAEAARERPDGGDVGATDEAHRPVDRLAEGQGRVDRSQRSSCRALTTISAPLRRGRRWSPPTVTSQRRCDMAVSRRRGAGSRPQSSTTPACSSVNRVTDAPMSAAARDIAAPACDAVVRTGKFTTRPRSSSSGHLSLVRVDGRCSASGTAGRSRRRCRARAEAEQLSIRQLSARRPRCSVSNTWSGIGAPSEVAERPGHAPVRTDERDRDATAATDGLQVP